MADDARIDYRVTRHAPVRGDDDVLWVSIARWVHRDGSVEWCLEYWDDVGEADHDLEVPDEASAMQRARDELGVEDTDWRPGPQPWGRQTAPEATAASACREQRGESGRPSGWLLRWTSRGRLDRRHPGARSVGDAKAQRAAGRPALVPTLRARGSVAAVLA